MNYYNYIDHNNHILLLPTLLPKEPLSNSLDIKFDFISNHHLSISFFKKKITHQ